METGQGHSWASVSHREVSRDEDAFRTLPFVSAPLGESALFSPRPLLSEEQLPEQPVNKVCNYSRVWEMPIQTLRQKLVPLSWFRISQGRTGWCSRHSVHP